MHSLKTIKEKDGTLSYVSVPMERWDKQDKSEWDKFYSAAKEMAKDIKYAPEGEKNFAVYWSLLVADNESFQDPSCPKAPFVSYGHICKNKMRAKAIFRGRAFYSLQDIRPTLFAHEQIGHSFAQLDDEYEECDKDIANYSAPHLNCTSKDKVKVISQPGLIWNNVKYETKWGNMADAKLGCGYTQKYYRSTQNSIMRNTRTGGGDFGPVNRKIIDFTAKYNSPGPPEWAEELSAQCSVK
ncbi:MAG: hypothetical protein NT170_02775 [Candidatus Moranbacteria bacterium]|nr:hypothetical protein [Candidatus Moranbacteria bacterium]